MFRNGGDETDEERDEEPNYYSQIMRNFTNPTVVLGETVGLGVYTAAGIGNAITHGGWALGQAVSETLPIFAFIYGLVNIGEGIAIWRGTEHPDKKNQFYSMPFEYSSTERKIRGFFQAFTGFAIAEGAAEMMKGVNYSLTIPALGLHTPLSGLCMRMAAHFAIKFIFDLRDAYLLAKNWESSRRDYDNTGQPTKLIINLFTNLSATIAFIALAFNPISMLAAAALGLFILAKSFQHYHRPIIFFGNKCCCRNNKDDEIPHLGDAVFSRSRRASSTASNGNN
jgi:hypothetical protein